MKKIVVAATYVMSKFIQNFSFIIQENTALFLLKSYSYFPFRCPVRGGVEECDDIPLSVLLFVCCKNLK